MLRRTLFAPALAATLLLAACDQNAPTAPQTLQDDDYALVMFGTAGSALEGTMGRQGTRPYDGSTAQARLPDEIKLTDAQKAQMEALRSAFRTANAANHAALKAIFDEAKAAREAGKTRAEVRAILERGKPIADQMRAAVQALHTAIQAVLTDAQRAWLAANKPGRGNR